MVYWFLMENSHHAICIKSDSLENSLLPEKYQTQSIDVLHFNNPKFGIDDVRALQTQVYQSATGKDGRTFVIKTKSLTVEAQNALLKLFEEPPAGVRFYLVVPAGVNLLATLSSRLQFASAEIINNNELKEWLALPIGDRLAMVAQMTKEKNREWIDRIVMQSQQYAIKEDGLSAKKSTVLVGSYINSSGASSKMLLEELALSLP